MRKEQKIIERIKKLKREKNAIILAHNYQPSIIQDIADFVGDSLELSRKAAKTDADIILFCGVKFMAESAKILSPDKKVLIPDQNAGCPLADSISLSFLREMKRRYPEAKVVTYVNSSAEIKSESYVCCTSSNALEIVEKVPSKDIIFIPDKNLGSYVADRTDKNMIIWDGFCPVHNSISVEDVGYIKKRYPNAKLVLHPECPKEVLTLADYVGSTAGILRYSKTTKSNVIIVGTEKDLIHRLELENPTKRFLPLTNNFICSNMKKTTLEKIVSSLEDLKFEITIPQNLRMKAFKALNKMLEMSN